MSKSIFTSCAAASTFYSGMGGYGYRGFGGMGTASTVVNGYAVGTLVVDMFEAKSMNLVFRGIAEDEISDNPDRNKQRLEKASHKLPSRSQNGEDLPERRANTMSTTLGIERVLRVAVVAALLAAATACAGAPRQRPVQMGPVATGPGTVADARKFLQGRWALESFEVRPPGGTPINLKGSGVLNYDDFGNLRMEIRTDTATSDLLRAAGIAIQDGVISSDGRTVIDLPNKTLTYFIEDQRSSLKTGGGPLALNRPRHWEVTADTLTLTTNDDSGAPYAISRWRRSQ